MANEYTIGQKISGIGAALSGQVPQFQQQMEQLDEKRMEAMYKDAGAAYQLLNNKDYQGIIDLANDRLGLLQRLPGSDPSDTMQVLQLSQAAQAGNLQAQSQLTQVLESAYQQGLARGYYAAPAGPKYLGIEQGMMMFQNPDESIETRPLPTNEGWIDPAEKAEALRGAKGGLEAWNKNASEVIAAYDKVMGLEPEIRGGKNRAAINAAIMNVARLISPGVVTDKDATAMSGAPSPYEAVAYAINNLSISEEQFMRVVDPLNPTFFNADALLSVARSVTSSQIPSLMNTRDDLANVASQYNASDRFLNSYLGESKTFKNLKEIYASVSGDASLAFASEEDAENYAKTSGIPDGTKIVVNGQAGVWSN